MTMNNKRKTTSSTKYKEPAQIETKLMLLANYSVSGEKAAPRSNLFL